MPNKAQNIPIEDIPLITELVKTMSLTEVAEKWEVYSDSLSRFIRRHKLSVHEIRRDFRVKFIKDNPGVDNYELGQIFNCAEYTARELKFKIKTGAL